MQEKHIVKSITDVFKLVPDCWYHVTHGNYGNPYPSRKGIPDIVGWYSGRPFAIECKTGTAAVEKMRSSIRAGTWMIEPGLSKTQRAQCTEIVAVRRAGGRGIITNNVDDVIEALGLAYEISPLFGHRGAKSRAESI